MEMRAEKKVSYYPGVVAKRRSCTITRVKNGCWRQMDNVDRRQRGVPTTVTVTPNV